jgi:hypothetical protein
MSTKKVAKVAKVASGTKVLTSVKEQAQAMSLLNMQRPAKADRASVQAEYAAQRQSAKVAVAKKAKKAPAKALAVAQERKTESAPRAGSLVEIAVKALLRSKSGLTRDEVQEKSGMSRKLSSWDFGRLAAKYDHELIVSENKDGRALYRFAR